MSSRAMKMLVETVGKVKQKRRRKSEMIKSHRDDTSENASVRRQFLKTLLNRV